MKLQILQSVDCTPCSSARRPPGARCPGVGMIIQSDWGPQNGSEAYRQAVAEAREGSIAAVKNRINYFESGQEFPPFATNNSATRYE